jgi:hypothetical protein
MIYFMRKSAFIITQPNTLYKFILYVKCLSVFFVTLSLESFGSLRVDFAQSFAFPPQRCEYIYGMYELMPPIIKYAYKGQAALMAKEIRNGYSPNHVYANKFPAMGYCPLAGAIYANSYKGVKLLLEAGANPNILFTAPLIFNDSNYNTLNTHALAFAICRNADIKIIKLLIVYGADINRAHNPFSKDYLLTPLMLAEIMGNKKVADLIR